MSGRLPSATPPRAFPLPSDAYVPTSPPPRVSTNDQTDSAVRVLIARLVDLEQRVKTTESASVGTAAVDARLAALERLARGADQTSRATAAQVDGESRSVQSSLQNMEVELNRR